jgi:hypothetical protein
VANSYISGISLRLRHAESDVGTLLEHWGLDVRGSWRAGEPRTTPRGNLLTGVWPESYAYSRLPVRGETLNQRFDSAIKLIEPFASELTAFADSGGRCELFVGWHFETNSGDELGWELLGKLFDLRLDLSLDIYPEVEPEMKELAHGQA